MKVKMASVQAEKHAKRWRHWMGLEMKGLRVEGGGLKRVRGFGLKGLRVERGGEKG